VGIGEEGSRRGSAIVVSVSACTGDERVIGGFIGSLQQPIDGA
jgi:hypothetical protein